MAVRKGLPHSANLGRQGLKMSIKLDGKVHTIPIDYSKSDFVDYDAGVVDIPNNLGDGKSTPYNNVSLALPEEDWEVLQLELKATIHPDMSKVIPETERKTLGIEGVAELSVSVRCSATSLRRSVSLTEDEGGSGTYSATCELKRSEVKGYIDVNAKLTRTTDAPKGTTASLARNKRAFLADSPIVKIYIDRTPGAELVKYAFVNFETYQGGKLKEWKSQLYWIDFSSQEQVVCYINNQSKEWKPLIEKEYGKSTKGGRIREYMGRSLVAQILNSVYPYAFMQNSGLTWDLIKDGDSWHRYALEELARVKNPTGSADDRAAWIDTHLQSLQGDESDSSNLLREIGLLVQKQMKIRSSGEKLARSLVDFVN